MTKEELLRWDGAGGVDDDLLAGVVRPPHEGGDVREEGSLELAGLIARLPQVALESLQIGDLDVPGDEVADVRLQGAAVIAILLWKGAAILGEAGAVPLLVEDLGERIKGVGKLDVALRVAHHRVSERRWHLVCVCSMKLEYEYFGSWYALSCEGEGASRVSRPQFNSTHQDILDEGDRTDGPLYYMPIASSLASILLRIPIPVCNHPNFLLHDVSGSTSKYRVGAQGPGEALTDIEQENIEVGQISRHCGLVSHAGTNERSDFLDGESAVKTRAAMLCLLGRRAPANFFFLFPSSTAVAGPSIDSTGIILFSNFLIGQRIETGTMESLHAELLHLSGMEGVESSIARVQTAVRRLPVVAERLHGTSDAWAVRCQLLEASVAVMRAILTDGTTDTQTHPSTPRTQALVGCGWMCYDWTTSHARPEQATGRPLAGLRPEGGIVGFMALDGWVAVQRELAVLQGPPDSPIGDAVLGAAHARRRHHARGLSHPLN